MFGYSYALIDDASYLSKPMPPVPSPAPDISNFIGNDELGRQYNFLVQFLKFLPKHEVYSYAGLRKADEGEGHELKYWDAFGQDSSWWVTDEWYNAFNEYSIDPSLYNNTTYSGASDQRMRSTGNEPQTNSDVLEWFYEHGQKGLNWHGDWVAGWHHFNIGVKENQYYWGDGTGAAYGNLDFVADANEWNLIGVKGKRDQKDPRWNNSFAQDPVFVDQFLSFIDSSPEEMNGVLDRFDGLNYYEIVMNVTKGSNSYRDLSTKDRVLLLGAMVKSRNSGWKAMEEVFGPVVHTWNDAQMIDHFKSWLSRNNVSVFSHAIDLFKFFLQIQHSVINQLTMFYKDAVIDGFSGSALDNYGFTQFVKDMGREYYSDRDLDGGGKSKGAIFEYLEDEGFNLGEIMGFMRSDLPELSISTTPEDVKNLLPVNSYFNGLSGAQKNKLSAVKWLVEQWFGATKVKAGYNSIPKFEGKKPPLDINNPDHYSTMEFEGIGTVKIPTSITDPGSARSYCWDRVAGPFGSWGNPFGRVDADWVTDTQEGWRTIMARMRSDYGMAYISPYTTANHRGYARTQFGSLSYSDIEGLGARGEVAQNSWPVYMIGKLYLAGYDTDMMRLWNWLNTKGMMRKEHEKDREAYDEAKERIEWEKNLKARIEAKVRAEQNRLKKETSLRLEKKRKARQDEFKKLMDKIHAQKKAENRRNSAKVKPKINSKKKA